MAVSLSFFAVLSPAGAPSAAPASGSNPFDSSGWNTLSLPVRVRADGRSRQERAPRSARLKLAAVDCQPGEKASLLGRDAIPAARLLCGSGEPHAII